MKVTTVEFYDVGVPNGEELEDKIQNAPTKEEFYKLQKEQNDLMIDECKKFAKALEKEVPGLQMNFIGDPGVDNFGPEFELKHEDELTLRKAFHMCNALGGCEYHPTEEAIKIAHELLDELTSQQSDKDILNDESYTIWDE